MALVSDAAMVLFYDIAGDNADHDDWHTYEHMHERLSIPGFLRATRWVARTGAPKYLVIYEVTGTDMATSPAYLARLNAPTPWTRSMMARFRGMIRGFCRVAASSGFGFGPTAVSIRFTPMPAREAELTDRLAREVLPIMSSRRGMTSIHLLQPGPPPPATQEQSLRGTPDAPIRGSCWRRPTIPMPWIRRPSRTSIPSPWGSSARRRESYPARTRCITRRRRKR